MMIKLQEGAQASELKLHELCSKLLEASLLVK